MAIDARLLQYRITLELASPLAIGSGDSDDLFDAPCARDANGLPAIPGTSLAGALRSLWGRQFGELSAQAWFGSITPNTDEGERSRVLLSWAHVHDITNKAVDGLVTAATIGADLVLTHLLRLPQREHVRLDHRGGAVAKAKFDRSFVPTGCRFSFDLRVFITVQQQEGDIGILATMWQMLWQGDLWLGGAKSGGYGRTKVIAIKEVIFDLTRKGARQAAQGARKLQGPLPEASKENGIERRTIALVGTGTRPTREVLPCITLALRDTWRIGTGTESVAKLKDSQFNKKRADALPYAEDRLVWKGSPGHGGQSTQWVAEVVVPGSAIRGALAHRTTFHFNRLLRQWSRPLAPDAARAIELALPVDVVEVLFGSAKTQGVLAGDAETTPTGHAGAVFVEDVRISTAGVKVVQLPHVRIDRFTGGAFGGALFSEELLFQGSLELRVSIDKTRLLSLAQVYREAAATALKALDEALRDLCEQRLAIGAGGAHGHGYCTGNWPTEMDATLRSLAETLEPANEPVEPEEAPA